MDLKSIFKMEMFKNMNDKQYLIVIAILAIAMIGTSLVGLHLLENGVSNPETMMLLMPLIVFSFIGLWAFSILYPFHLLNMDYKNNVIGLIFASGVSREKYYMVKVGATILSSFVAIFIITIVPIIIFFVVYQDVFVMAVKTVFASFNVKVMAPLGIYMIMSLLSSTIVLTTSVIITKGKFVGIFLSFLFSFISSSIIGGILSAFGVEIYSESMLNYLYINSGMLILNCFIFVFIGLQTLKKQNL